MKEGSPLEQLWRRATGGFFGYPPHAIKVKAPVLLVSSSPLTLYPGREAPGVAPLGLDPEDMPSATTQQVVAYLDPAFRPEDFPQDIEFALEERLYPDVRNLRKGDWLCVTFVYDRKSYGIASVERIDAPNVIIPAFGRKPG